MAKDDWAIVVGITNYFDPALSGLQGPETDATEFYDWVVKDDGGAVPKGQAVRILSSDFQPPFATAAAAMPTAAAITSAFDHLRSVAKENAVNGIGRTVGRRLYLFFAGHGFAPSQRADQTALFTAEASIAAATLSHVLGPYVADFFWQAKYFEEILLFMDCCRERMECAQLNMPFPDESATDFHKVKRFYAYGARVAKDSREWKMSDQKVHGVFTKTLLDALGGTAYDPRDPSTITAESLRDQLYNGFKGFMSDADRKRPDIPDEPEVVYEQKPGGNFTIVSRAGLVARWLGRATIPTYAVTITVAAPQPGNAIIRNKDLDVAAEMPIAPTMTVRLQRGFYSLEMPGAAAPIMFEVTGSEKTVDA